MYGFKAFVFNGKETASKALDTLEDHMPTHTWIEDAAVVSRSKLGSIRIHGTWAQDDRAVCALAGAAGAMFGVTEEIAFDDPRLDDFAASLDYDTSALILVGEKATLADFGIAIAPFGGKVVETDLNEDDVKALRKALKKAN